VTYNAITDQNLTKVFIFTGGGHGANAAKVLVGEGDLRVLRRHFIYLEFDIISSLRFGIDGGSKTWDNQYGVIVNAQESDQSDDNEHDRANANQHAIHSKKAKYMPLLNARRKEKWSLSNPRLVGVVFGTKNSTKKRAFFARFSFARSVARFFALSLVRFFVFVSVLAPQRPPAFYASAVPRPALGLLVRLI
jgi:hypothetical protein